MTAQAHAGEEQQQPPSATNRPRGLKVSPELADQARACVDFIQAHVNHRETLTAWVEDAVRTKLEADMARYNNGQPFPKLEGMLRPGRRFSR